MTSVQNPVGACGDAAPTGDLNTIARARGVLSVEADTYRHERDQARASLEVLAAAVTGGQRWEIQAALHRAHLTLQQTKDRP